MLSKVFIGLAGFGKLSTHELVLPSQCLDVLHQLLHLTRFCMSDLRLLINPMSQVLAFFSQGLDLLLPLLQSPLYSVLLPGDSTQLMLCVRELP